MSKKIETFVFKGTAKQFEAKGVKLNGQLLDQITVNALGRHGLIECVGEGDKPARGKTPKLYGVKNSKGMQWSVPAESAQGTVPDEVAAVETKAEQTEQVQAIAVVTNEAAAVQV